MSAAEKAYHFLAIFDSVRSAREVLKAVEIAASGATERETRRAGARSAATVTLVVYMIMAGATIATLGLATVLCVAARVRGVNRELKVTNHELRVREIAIKAVSTPCCARRRRRRQPAWRSRNSWRR